jgi:hypothetical protein
MRRPGLIGGTSWISTIGYYRHINQIGNERPTSRSRRSIRRKFTPKPPSTITSLTRRFYSPGFVRKGKSDG